MSPYSNPTTLETPWKTIEKTLKTLLRNANLFRAVNSRIRVQVLDVPEARLFAGRYLISSDRGAFALEKGRIFQLTRLETYGLALRGKDELFMAVSNDDYSAICRCRLPEEMTPGAELEVREVRRIPIHRSGRVHQIAFYNQTLAITQTAANSIAFLNPDSGELLSECLPFRDRFGKPIRGDHNHINSVSACGDCLLFCAYKAGSGSMIGVIDKDRVKGYSVSNMGAHDVYISGRTLYYSDTFGATFTDGSSECGFLMANGRPVDAEFFNIPPGFAVRGVSKQGSEMILAHSHKGPRAKRFEGHGSLFRLVDDKVVNAVKAPFAQIYDIVGRDGLHFEVPPAVESWTEVTGFLETILGPAIYEETLDEPVPAGVAARSREMVESGETGDARLQPRAFIHSQSCG